MNIRNCLNKNILYATFESASVFDEGVVHQITPNAVNISGRWIDINQVIVKEVLNDNINESGNGGEKLING